MAGFRGHISAGVLFGALMLAALSFTTLAEGLTLQEMILQGLLVLWLAVVFALFPDVDIKSKGQLFFYRLLFVLDAVLVATEHYTEAAVLGLLALIPILSKHRGWTHTVWAMLLVPSPILLVPMYFQKAAVLDGLPYYLGAVSGYFSHLLADGMLFRRR